MLKIFKHELLLHFSYLKMNPSFWFYGVLKKQKINEFKVTILLKLFFSQINFSSNLMNQNQNNI